MVWKWFALPMFLLCIILFLLLGTVTTLIGTPQPNVQSCPTYLRKPSMTPTSERSYLSGLTHHSSVTPDTINFNTQYQSTVSAIHSDNYIRNLLPSFQSVCASQGKHFKNLYTILMLIHLEVLFFNLLIRSWINWDLRTSRICYTQCSRQKKDAWEGAIHFNESWSHGCSSCEKTWIQ
jgi:hypothetical protein